MGEENGLQAGESRGGQRKERLKLNAVPRYAVSLKTIIMMTKHYFFHSFVVCKEDQQQNQTWAQACSFSASLSFPLALPALPSHPAQRPPPQSCISLNQEFLELAHIKT